ncbi:CheC, inhibitor of MCP methylation [Solidesulfovibrio fructosivorans JJ]]|uniref:CheC, inhibitor of MCP methylation n=1 Tax=Solidesulfovibrio fructosivorans JJ] TaxID=596151 RepID=E1JZQ2_SOLFR|nr:chemotaxis protein CheC [Solidesulfovibrio fructosivorans]EFL50187.1 CheC, inhibitor of MCP methylation [Solidesulfovibrio fructosivorans JJ]]
MPLSPLQLDILQELINIGVGRAAGMLNQMVNTHIQLQVPVLKVVSTAELAAMHAGRANTLFSVVQLQFSGGFAGISALVFPPESASKLVSVVLGKEGMGCDEAMRCGTLQEVGNIVLNGVMGSIANILKEPLHFAPPDFVEADITDIIGRQSSMILVACTQFSIKDHLIEGEVLIIFSLSSFDALLAAIDSLAGTA